MPTRFAGFPKEGMKFFNDLRKNNNREWFSANKQIFDDKVKAPMVELVNAVNAELATFGPDHVTEPAKAIYRIYRDTRFSADKTPYKDHIAANFPRRGLEKHACGGYYFSVSSKTVEIGGGIYMPGPDELLALRNYFLEAHEALRRILKDPKRRSLTGEINGDRLSRPPKGFPSEHPSTDLLKYKQMYFYVTLTAENTTTPKLLPDLVKRLRAMQPLVDFVNVPLLARKREARPDPVVTERAPSSRRQGAGR